jgi:hypothetical protein
VTLAVWVAAFLALFAVLPCFYHGFVDLLSIFCHAFGKSL